MESYRSPVYGADRVGIVRSHAASNRTRRYACSVVEPRRGVAAPKSKCLLHHRLEERALDGGSHARDKFREEAAPPEGRGCAGCEVGHKLDHLPRVRSHKIVVLELVQDFRVTTEACRKLDEHVDTFVEALADVQKPARDLGSLLSRDWSWDPRNAV